MDQNGTVYVAGSETYATNFRVVLGYWHSLPSRPVITSIASGTGRLTVTWTAPPEADIATYRIWRSNDGSTYTLVSTVNAPTLTYTDTGLANGTYWYKIDAVDVLGDVSHESVPASGIVGPTTQQLIDALNAQIAALQAQLAQVNASSAAAIAAAQAQITALQAQLTSLQSSQAASNAATAAELARLQANITALQGQLNSLQGQQATQSISYANLAFEIIVVVLLVVLLLNQMRKPKSPQLMMAQPGQAEPKKPEDDL